MGYADEESAAVLLQAIVSAAGGRLCGGIHARDRGETDGTTHEVGRYLLSKGAVLTAGHDTRRRLLRWMRRLAVLWALGYAEVLLVTVVPATIFYSGDDSRSGMEALGAYLRYARQSGTDRCVSFLQFHRLVADGVDTRDENANNPFPGALPEKTYGRMAWLPEGLAAEETPLLWDTEADVEGRYHFLLWDGTVGCLPVDDLLYDLPNMELFRKCDRSLDPLMSHLAKKAGLPTLPTAHGDLVPPPWFGRKRVLMVAKTGLLLAMCALVFMWIVRPILVRRAGQCGRRIP
jgi:hypothetical protein